MAAFKTTSVAILRADQPTIVQRLIATSERFLFHPPAASLLLIRAHARDPVVLHDDARFCLSCRVAARQARRGVLQHEILAQILV